MRPLYASVRRWRVSVRPCGVLAVEHEGLLLHLDVNRSPPHVVHAGRLLDDALVLGRAARLGAGSHRKGARRGEVATALALQRRLDKDRHRRVVHDLSGALLDICARVWHCCWAVCAGGKEAWCTFGSGKGVRTAVSVGGGDLVADRRWTRASQQVLDVRKRLR